MSDAEGERGDPRASDSPRTASVAAPTPAPPLRIYAVRRAALWIVGGAVLVATPLVARVAWEGAAELEAADRAASAGEVDAEIEHLGRAARWRAFGLSHDERALDRLRTVAEDAEAEGQAQRHVALAAYREIRRALLATRSFSVPHPERYAEANAHIASLMAQQEQDFGGSRSTAEAEAYHRALLEPAPGPDPWRANVASLAFVAWLVSAGGFVLRGLDGQGRLRPRPALRWGLVSLFALVAWALLLARAG